MSKYELNFHRYFANGSLHITVPVDEVYINKYPNSVRNTTTRFRVWENGKRSTPIINGNHHVVTDLFQDDEFINVMENWVYIHEGCSYKKFLKSWGSPAANFFCAFVNHDDTAKVRKARAVKQNDGSNPQPKREKKVVDEKKSSFHQLKKKLKNKISYIQKMFNWEENKRFTPSDEKFRPVANKLFVAYKEFFEEMLSIHGISFISDGDNIDVPFQQYTPYFYANYILLNNPNNISEDLIKKNSFRRVSLLWYSTKKTLDLINRHYKTRVLDINTIGICKSGHSHSTRSGVNKLIKMQEGTFLKIINEIYQANTKAYGDNLQSFLSIDDRSNANTKNIQKLKDFLTNEIISYVDPKYVVNKECDFENNGYFSIVMAGETWRVSKNPILKVSVWRDNMENMQIEVDFFSSMKDYTTTNVDDAIAAIQKVFGGNFGAFVKVYDRARAL